MVHLKVFYLMKYELSIQRIANFSKKDESHYNLSQYITNMVLLIKKRVKFEINSSFF